MILEEMPDLLSVNFLILTNTPAASTHQQESQESGNISSISSQRKCFYQNHLITRDRPIAWVRTTGIMRMAPWSRAFLRIEKKKKKDLNKRIRKKDFITFLPNLIKTLADRGGAKAK